MSALSFLAVAACDSSSPKLHCCDSSQLLYLLQNLSILHSHPALIFCDNQSTIQLAHNPMFHERTKHIEIYCHFIHEKLTEGIITLLLVTSAN